MIVDLIYKHLETEAAESIHVSKSLTASIFDRCKRRNWYAIKLQKPGEGGAWDAEALLRSRDGNVFHVDIVALCEECGLEVLDSEFPVYCKTEDGKVSIYARVDAKVRTQDKLIVNLEIKTMNEERYATFKKYGLKAFESYYTQAQIIKGAEPNFPLILLCKSRGAGGMCEEEVELDQAYVAGLLSYKKEFDESLTQSAAPERPYQYTSAECRGCDYFRRCWFSTIRSETLMEHQLSDKERTVISKLKLRAQKLMLGATKYECAYNDLTDYMAYLHDKHAVKYIKTPMANSVVVTANKTHVDRDYVRSVLTEEQEALAFTQKISQFVKVNPKWDREEKKESEEE